MQRCITFHILLVLIFYETKTIFSIAARLMKIRICSKLDTGILKLNKLGAKNEQNQMLTNKFIMDNFSNTDENKKLH